MQKPYLVGVSLILTGLKKRVHCSHPAHLQGKTSEALVRLTVQSSSSLDAGEQILPSHQVLQEGTLTGKRERDIRMEMLHKIPRVPFLSVHTWPPYHYRSVSWSYLCQEVSIFRKKQSVRHSKNETPELGQEPDSGMLRPLQLSRWGLKWSSMPKAQWEEVGNKVSKK